MNKLVPVIVIVQLLQFINLQAQVTFISNGQLLNKLAGRGVVLADFNHDGNTDAFVVNDDGPEGKGYRVYFGNGEGGFRDSISLINPIPWSSQPVAGDFTGNGGLEVITGWTVWTTDNKGNFTADTTRFSGPHDVTLNHIAAADFNKDGFLDLFISVYSRSVNELRVYLNNGKGHFIYTGQKLGQDEGVHYPVALGDINGDGYIDAVTTGWRNKNNDPCPNRIFINNGNGFFKETDQLLEEGGSHSHGLAIADIDNDGDQDIIVGIQSAPFARIYLNNGQGNFTPGQTLGDRSVEKIFVADFNKDGNVDLFLACNGPNEVWLNDGKGIFTDSGVRLGSEWSWNAAIGDLNNDGKQDIFVVNFSGEFKQNVYTARGRHAEVWLNKSTNNTK